jgi:hypothetical protein
MEDSYHIEVLSMGETAARKLKHNLSLALNALGVSFPIKDQQDLDTIIASGVVAIPAILINGEILFQKRYLPDANELKGLIGSYLNSSTPKNNKGFISHTNLATDRPFPNVD